MNKKKKKNAEAAAHFHIKAPKISQVIIILRKFVREDLISVISFLLDRHSIFICSITGLSSPPPLCQHATFIYCAKYVNTYTGKSFCWQMAVGGVGGGGGGTFPNFYIFHCKKHSFCPKLSPCSIPEGKLIPFS